METYQRYFQLTLLLLLQLQWCPCSAQEDKKDKGRIIGGEKAPKHMYPYVALFQVYTDKNVWFTLCHGIITNPYTILTVNFCVSTFFSKGSKPRAVAGIHNVGEFENMTQIRPVCKSEAVAPTKDTWAFKDAYAVVHLKEPFRFNKYVNSIDLTPSATGGDTSLELCWFVSWARAAKEAINIYQHPLHKQLRFRDCEQKFKHSSTFCSNNDNCWDMGAPVVCTNNQDKSNVYAKALAVRYGDTYTQCAGTSVFVNLRAMDKGWYRKSQQNAKADCRPENQQVINTY